MHTPLESLIASGTKLWLDSVDPDLVRQNRALGATGATSNPVIISDLLTTERYAPHLAELAAAGHDDEEVAWRMTDRIVSDAQRVFEPVWEQTGGDDGWVSFELDPLVEEADRGFSHQEQVDRYIELGRHWSAGRRNRMIKVPATEAGLAAVEELVAEGVTPNITLIFTMAQYERAREAVWRGAQRRDSLGALKSVYSVFLSRIDVYTDDHTPGLPEAARGMVGIVSAKRIWKRNQQFWADKRLPLAQEIVFASTGTKKKSDPAWKYVEALAGSDIQTNPPATNDAVQKSGLSFSRRVDQLPADDVLAAIDEHVDFDALEATLVQEGMKKFADPQRKLLATIAGARS